MAAESSTYNIPVKIDPKGAVAGAAVAGQAVTGLGDVARKVTAIVRSLVLALGGISAAIALTIGITQLAKFEDAMAKVRAVTGATDKQFLALNRTTRRLGATTVFTATQAGTAALFLGRAGFTASEITVSLGKALLLARAGGLELEAAADVTANTLRGFNIAAAESGRVVDVLALATASANTTVQELGEGIKFVAPVAASLGVSFEETVAALGKLSDAGLKSTLAGTGLRRVLSGLANPTGVARKLFKSLGIDVSKLDLRTRSMAAVMKELADAGVGASEALTLFGLRGGPAFLVLKNALPDVEKLTEELLMAAGRAQEMADTIDDTLLASFKSLISAVSESVLQFDKQAGTLRNLVIQATGVISVWNGMGVEFAAGNNLSVEALRNIERLAEAIKNLTIVSLALVAVPLLKYFGILSVLGGVTIGGLITSTAGLAKGTVGLAKGLFGAARAGTTLNAVLSLLGKTPLLLVLTIITTAIGAFLAFYKSTAEEIKNITDGVKNNTDRLRDAVGNLNYADKAFGGSLSLTRQKQEVASAEKDINNLRDSAKSLRDELGDALGGVGAIQGRLERTSLIEQQRQIAIKLEGAETQEEVREYTKQLTNINSDIVSFASKYLENTERIEKLLEEGTNNLVQNVTSRVNRSEDLAGLQRGGINERTSKTAASAPTAPGSFGGADQNLSILSALTEENRVRQVGLGIAKGVSIADQARALALKDIEIQFGNIEQQEKDRIRLQKDHNRYVAEGNAYLKELEKIKESAATNVDGTDNTASQEYIDAAKALENYTAKFNNEVEIQKAKLEGPNGLGEVFRKTFDAKTLSNKLDLLSKVDERYQSIAETLSGPEAARARLEQETFVIQSTRLLKTDEARAEAIKELQDRYEDLIYPIKAQNEELRKELELVGKTGLEKANFAVNEQIAERVAQIARLDEIKDLQQILELERQINELGIQKQLNTETDQQNRSQQFAGADGELSPLEQLQQAAQGRQEGGDAGDGEEGLFGTVKDNFLLSLGEMVDSTAEASAKIGTSLGSAFKTAQKGLGNLITDSLLYGKSFGDGIKSIARGFADAIIRSLIQIGVQMLITWALGKLLGTKAAAASSVQAVTSAVAWAPAATLASIATFGGAAVAGGIAVTATLAATTAAAAVLSGIGAGSSIAAAAGGLISGPGGPKDDAIPARLSDGEFVVNAESTKRNLALLEAINRGGMLGQGYAFGGEIGGNTAQGSGQVGASNVSIQLINQTSTEVDIEERQDALTGQIVLTIKEAIAEGAFDEEFEGVGANRLPEL